MSRKIPWEFIPVIVEGAARFKTITEILLIFTPCLIFVALVRILSGFVFIVIFFLCALPSLQSVLRNCDGKVRPRHTNRASYALGVATRETCHLLDGYFAWHGTVSRAAIGPFKNKQKNKKKPTETPLN